MNWLQLHTSSICFAWLYLVLFTEITAACCLQIVNRHRLQHEWYERLTHKMAASEPPCMSDAADWESSNGWAAELDLVMVGHC